MNKKNRISLLLALVLVLSSFSTVFAATGDLTVISDSSEYTLAEWTFDNALFSVITFAPQNYLVEIGGSNYNLEQVNNLMLQGNTLDQAAAIIDGADDLSVVSVSAINATQIKVVFNQKVDETTAEDISNYKLDTAALNSTTPAAATDASAEVQADGKTVILTAGTTGGFTAFTGNGGTGYALEISGVKDLSKASKITKTSKSFVYEDKVAPTLVSISAKAKTTTNVLTVKFSEPVVVASGIVKVNGVNASVSAGAKPGELNVTSASPLTAGQTYSVQVLNFTDTEGNLMDPATVTQNVTVVKDEVAPIVKDLKIVRDNLLEVTFDKDMDASTVIAANVKFLDTNAGTVGIATPVAKTINGTTSRRVFTIALGSAPTWDANNKFNANIVFTSDIKDLAGNAITSTTKSIQLVRDTKEPTVESMRFIKADATPGATYGSVTLANGALVVKFDENVSKAAGMAIAGWSLIDQTGANVTVTYLTGTELTASRVNTTDATELVIPLATSVTTASGVKSLTVRIPSGQAEDLAFDTNGNEAAAKSVNVEAGSGVTDVTAPTVGFTSVTSPSATDGNVIVLSVTEANNLDTATVLNLNNYRLDGSPLPSGTYVTIGAQSGGAYPVSLHLPLGSVAKTKNYSLTVSGIKDAAGNVMTSTGLNAIGLTDDVQPEMTGATINADGTMTVSFSESMADGAGSIIEPVATDFIVTLNGTDLVGTTPAFTVAGISAGADAGKVVVTVNTREVGIAAVGGTVTDVNGKTYTGTGTNVMKFVYLDVNGDGSFSAGDIVLSAVDTGAATPITDAASGTINLNNETSVKIKTKATPAAKDADGNVLKGNKSITVK